ncbi:MAG: DUF262 domain-containing protein, partial [Cytophagales bacterium]|nr:DUF262 domain-containing protein [Cytophagales bacterium]
MNNAEGLKALDGVFYRRLFRIPDYQRGYSWTKGQWEDLWNDIQSIVDGRRKKHYAGVITLHRINEPKKSPEQALENLPGYAAYHVVDGQQRLTTLIILIKV